MNAAELFVRCLEAEGVEYIFGVPGEENAHFMMALETSDSIKQNILHFLLRKSRGYRSAFTDRLPKNLADLASMKTIGSERDGIFRK